MKTDRELNSGYVLVNFLMRARKKIQTTANYLIDYFEPKKPTTSIQYTEKSVELLLSFDFIESLCQDSRFLPPYRKNISHSSKISARFCNHFSKGKRLLCCIGARNSHVDKKFLSEALESYQR